MNLQNTFSCIEVSAECLLNNACAASLGWRIAKCYSCERDTGPSFEHLQVKIAKKNLDLLDEMKETIVIYCFNSQQHY